MKMLELQQPSLKTYTSTLYNLFLREIPRLHPNSVLVFLIIPIDISVFCEFFPSQRRLVKIVENIGLFEQLLSFQQ